jgi:hypothetical protein
LTQPRSGDVGLHGAGQEPFAALLDGCPARPEHLGVVVEGLGQRAFRGHIGHQLVGPADKRVPRREVTQLRQGASRSRRPALLGTATGISWGFVAAVIKELSSRLGDGIGAVFSNWSPYVLVAVGAATMLLASHALAAGPLAASQPGFTILDPFSASLLGLFLFSEHIKAGVPDLAGEALALSIVIAGVMVLSHSHLIVDDRPPAGYQACGHRERTG